jgi:hypothetical protein
MILGQRLQNIGSFIVYFDANSTLIDMNMNKTLIGNDYENKLKANRLHWINSPTINGFQQNNRNKLNAKQIIQNNQNSKKELIVNIAKAYPKEAKIKHWKRIFKFDANTRILNLTEKYELIEWKTFFKIHFFTVISENVTKHKGKVTLNNRLSLEYNDKVFDVIIKKKSLNCEERKIYRIQRDVLKMTLVSKLVNSTKGTFTIIFKF